jgi:hypothetical protein
MSESENMSLNEEESQENISSNPVEAGIEEESKPKEGKGSHKKENREGHTAQFEDFLKEIEGQTNLDAKLQMAIDFMEASLAQGGTPHFRSFWEARRLCLPLFKENISPVLRSQLWAKYSDLSKEARRLKELLDEQSAFAVEQIEIAIRALEQEIEMGQEQSSGEEYIEFPKSLKAKQSFYQDVQHQLNLLNVQASRINALRKELIKTEMRVRQKNKFFQRLSAAGDKVFPKRKELIKQISLQFIEDVDHFIRDFFEDSEARQESLFALREEIKALQSLAKVLTLNTSAFTQTRTRLSECWDKIKVEEKERKKERAQQKTVFKQNADMIQQTIASFKEELEKGEVSIPEGQKKIDEIITLMRKTDLGRNEIKALREEVAQVRKTLQDRTRVEEEARQQQEKEKARQKFEKFQAFKKQAAQLVGQSDQYEAEQLQQEKENLLAEVNESSLSKSEKQELERLLKPLRDIIADKKEKTMLTLSDDDRKSLQQLKEVLQQRTQRRQEIKNQLELMRKAAGASGLDFEKAMNYNLQMTEEKERLEKINQGIKEIEGQIAKLQAKVK